ncbi:MAG: hypothetical protein KJZ78_27180, partial [Bryobacteraceae bacterium]|nr:hypothetical protein [Bryobacteraceae bacterium]
MSFGTEHANVVSSRREALRRIAMLTGASAAASGLSSLAETTEPQTGEPDLVAGQAALSAEDQAFLDELEHAAFLYFWEQADPNTGLVKDRCNIRSGNDTGTVASIAATGFGLTALCIGYSRGFVPLADVRGRVIAALRFLYEKMPAHRGFFYHWADVHSGERTWNSEI